LVAGAARLINRRTSAGSMFSDFAIDPTDAPALSSAFACAAARFSASLNTGTRVMNAAPGAQMSADTCRPPRRSDIERKSIPVPVRGIQRFRAHRAHETTPQPSGVYQAGSNAQRDRREKEFQACGASKVGELGFKALRNCVRNSSCSRRSNQEAVSCRSISAAI
jgi:hypothetical protein